MRCGLCLKKPEEICEYIVAAREAGVSPNVYVRDEEGTFNWRTRLFYCTECYIKLRMPLGKAERIVKRG